MPHYSVHWKKYYQFHFTDEETEFVVTELVMAELGQNPSPLASTSLCPPTSFFPQSCNLVILSSGQAKATFGKNRMNRELQGAPPPTHVTLSSMSTCGLPR